MLIDITLGLDEITTLLREATPLRVHLTEKDEDRRWVEIEPPSDVVLVPGVGLRAVSSGRIRYELAGFHLPFVIRRLQLLFEPQVVRHPGGHERLEFKLSLEQADLENIPGFGDRALVNLVNGALAPTRLGLFWTFGHTLERSFAMPDRLEPLDQLELKGASGRVSVTASELRFSVQVGLAFSRSKPRPSDDA